MEQDGVVSIWIGVAASQADLDEYMMFRYTEEGEAIPCPFIRDFEIPEFNEDFKEAAIVTPPTRSLPDLVSHFSCGGTIGARLAEKGANAVSFDANAAVLLYNFRYDGKHTLANKGPVKLKYLGAVKYQ